MKTFAVAVLALGLPILAGAAPVFRNPLPVPIGTDSASEMLAGDFDGDHRDDVLIVNPGRDLVVLLANGSGPFAAPAVTPIPAYATSLPAIGDVNGDGRTDVLVSDWNTGTIGVMQGNGDGTFLAGPSFIVSGQPGPLALADFNGDHHLDLVRGSTGSSPFSVTVYLGDGAGHFSTGVATSVAQSTYAITTADMNGDGKPDLIAGTSDWTRILLGNGSGGFTPMGATAVDGDVVVDDFNHDGKPDLAVAAGGNHEWFIEVSLGNGDGTLKSPTRYAAGYNSSSMDAADVDGDGNVDLLAAGTHGSAVTILRGKADGTFHAPELWLSGPGAWKILADDYDRDGRIDFVTVDYNFEVWALSFVRGNGDGTFRTYRATHTGSVVPVIWPGLWLRAGVTADMNNDDKEDVVVIQQHPNTYPYDLGVLLNDGNGKLAAPILTDTGHQRWAVNPAFAIGDLNHDGKRDAVVLSNLGSPPRGSTFLGNGDGTFGAAIPFTVDAFAQPALGHFNGDTNLDLFVPSHDFATVYAGRGDGTFGAGIRSDVDAADAIAGDLNGDGRLDYISSFIRATYACVNDGTGRFTRQTITNEEIDATALGDFDADGKLDLLLTTYTGIQVRFGDGNGTFGVPVVFTIRPVPNYPQEGPVETADFDGDGKLDVAFGTTIYLGSGDGTFHSRARFRTTGGGAIQVADMDRSGSPDLVVMKEGADDVDVLLTRTTADPAAASSIALSSGKTTAQYAEAVTFTATVTGGAVPMAGVVAFKVDGKPEALIEVDDAGNASYTTAFAVGSHTVSATYTGDENYLESTDSVGVAATKATTTAFIAGVPNPRPLGLTVTISVSLQNSAWYGFEGPTGAMTLRDGDTPLPVPIVNGQAKIDTLSVGSHAIGVDYPGDANYEPATASYTQVITRPVPVLLVQFTPAEVLAGAPVGIRAYFTSTTITGTISFYVDDVFRMTVPLAGGSADLPATSFPWGQHSVRARYSGDATWAPSERSVSFPALIGGWGTPLAIETSAGSSGYAEVRWSQVSGAASYTLWRKKSIVDGWGAVGTYSSLTSSLGMAMDAGKSWLFAVTATDGAGNVSPMSAPDLATSVSFTEIAITPQVTPLKARHLVELRATIACVRTFAGLAAYVYSRDIIAGQTARASDLQEMRTALSQARATIGLPAIAFTDGTLTPSASTIRASHVMELLRGAN